MIMSSDKRSNREEYSAARLPQKSASDGIEYQYPLSPHGTPPQTTLPFPIGTWRDLEAGQATREPKEGAGATCALGNATPSRERSLRLLCIAHDRDALEYMNSGFICPIGSMHVR
ncbi:hypothetical protein EW146_g1564 [Bondarzewia mesenterica]|uniref:Uncharacterized protein n=1 Tax=Bondarzewia mesenterica TaxID=1095465 RepID=A0A4S4M5R6_9AGAM|nr:hypothetical protein EW146_g1564 [Bondarzewia mesenterica]